MDLEGLALDAAALDTLLDVDTQAWADEVADIGHYLDTFGERMPAKLRAEQQRVAQALTEANAPSRKLAAV